MYGRYKRFSCQNYSHSLCEFIRDGNSEIRRSTSQDDVIKWKQFPRYWPFVQRIHRWPANSPHKGQWHGAFMFSLICPWINDWVSNREAADLRRHRSHYDVTVMDYHIYQNDIIRDFSDLKWGGYKCFMLWIVIISLSIVWFISIPQVTKTLRACETKCR